MAFYVVSVFGVFDVETQIGNSCYPLNKQIYHVKNRAQAEAFETLKDPRNGKAKWHHFSEVLFIALSAMISAAWSVSPNSRRSGYADFLNYPRGMPSDDIFRRIVTTLDPKISLKASFSTSIPSNPIWVLS